MNFQNFGPPSQKIFRSDCARVNSTYEPDQTLPPMFSQDQKDALIGLRAELTCSMCKSLFINLVPKFSRLCIWFVLSLHSTCSNFSHHPPPFTRFTSLRRPPDTSVQPCFLFHVHFRSFSNLQFLPLLQSTLSTQRNFKIAQSVTFMR